MRIAGSGKSSDVSKPLSGQARKEAFSVGAINEAEVASTVAPAAATDAPALAFDLWEAGDKGRSRRLAVVEQQRRTLDVLGALQQAYLEDHIDPRLARELVRRVHGEARAVQADVERRVGLGQRARRGVAELLADPEILEEVEIGRAHV